MAAKRAIEVAAREDGWAVAREGSARALSKHRTQKEAEAAGRERARADRVEFVLRGRSGDVRKRENYSANGRGPSAAPSGNGSHAATTPAVTEEEEVVAAPPVAEPAPPVATAAPPTPTAAPAPVAATPAEAAPDAPEPAPAPAPAGPFAQPAATTATQNQVAPEVNRTPALICIASAALMLLGSFLPWATVESFGESITVSGTDEGGDGVITIVLALAMGVLAGFVLTGRIQRVFKVLVLVAAGSATAVALADVADVNEVAEEFGGLVDASVGIGLWMVLVAGIGGIVGGVLMKTGDRARAAAANRATP